VIRRMFVFRVRQFFAFAGPLALFRTRADH